jgi:thymidine kinase
MVSRDFEINNAVKKGWIEVVCGSMFSGKTEELIRRLNRAKIAKQKIEIFKPAIDKRYDDLQVVSHNANSIDSTPIEAASEILLLANNAEVIGIDEAQFFDEALPEVCTKLAEQGKRVIIAGLDMDFLGRPFGPMPHLLAIAEYVTKVHAICMQCGQLAYVSHRTSEEQQTVVVGEKDRYEPLCRACFNASKNN